MIALGFLLEVLYPPTFRVTDHPHLGLPVNIESSLIDLPTDFLSTPFGQSLRPTIDAMYRRPSPGVPAAPANAPPNPELAASILQSIAAQAQSNGGPSYQNRPPPLPATQSLTSPIHAITNPPAFNAFLKSHRAAVAFFTSNTCPPCRMIEPVFERLSEEKGLQEGRNGAGFAKVDIDVGMGRNLAAEYSVRATPTFMFFLDGKKVRWVKYIFSMFSHQHVARLRKLGVQTRTN